MSNVQSFIVGAIIALILFRLIDGKWIGVELLRSIRRYRKAKRGVENLRKLTEQNIAKRKTGDLE